MAISNHRSNPGDPALAERFLNGLDYVVDASAWLNGDTIFAHVTVTEDAAISDKDLQQACLTKVGLINTPKVIQVDRRARPAA
ncbi:MAG: hypothetical protein IH944_07820 [Armatimonadetes bacterium]|nr:hypothetical protein [Armatimonadota bacterium]